MDDGRIVGRKLYGQLTFESGISGISGLSGLSGRWRPDGRRVYMGTLHRRSENPVQAGMFKAPQAYYKTIIPKNPKKGALTPGSIF